MLGLMGGWSAHRSAMQQSGIDEDLARAANAAAANFRAYHGCSPDPRMNMFALIRDYSTPWRKTPIPKVQRKRRAAQQDVDGGGKNT